MALVSERGIRPRTRVWRGPDNYDYHKNRKVSGGRISYQCASYYLEHCLGRASSFPGGRGFRQTQPHNHDPDLFKAQSRALRLALMERCRNGDNTRFTEMYHQERRKLRIPRQAAARIPSVSLRSAMQRARLEKRPLIPKTIKALDKILRQRQYRALHRTLDKKDYLYAGRAGSASSKTISAIFATKRQLRRMKKVRKLYCDATFCPVPRAMKAHQVWTLSTIRQHQVVPLVRVLMRRRTTSSYEAALTKIKALSPQFQPTTIMSDFEGAQQKALGRAFPNAAQHGCLFHYARAVAGKARKLGMTKAMKWNRHVRTCVRMLCALPLLPQRYILEGFCAVGDRAIAKRISPQMVELLRYWVGFWRSKLHLLSVSGCSDRTSNVCESDNRNLQDAVRVKRPNVWNFMDF
ncbi:Sulfite reductase [NADPH] hemoprotein beta-component [Frankliniella fusca]|uniref:Sulfite reductase [NADPH] hemoprotein beta-component n=1 Tax=Frankliniella fusca TaxID=407009 RepID=A0AAE1H7K4_9NEOP|nr:Sulfite reductase [NADPH] hemoprotein beta-component [Frankliniella fusca]